MRHGTGHRLASLALSLSLVLVLVVLVTGRARSSDDPPGARLKALVAAGDYCGALSLADRLLEETPDSVPARQYRAYALHQLGRIPEAESAYEKTLALDPGNWWAWMNLGELYASLSRWSEAVAALERAVEIEPDLRDAWARLMRVLRESGDYEGAASKAEQALRLGIDPAFCHAELGYAWWVLGELDRSRDQWRLAREAGADPAACDHGLRLADWDRPSGTIAEKRETARRRRGLGDEWEFSVGVIDVRTRVGPKLPAEIRALLLDMQRDFGSFLDAEGAPTTSLRLVLSRTLEAHEAHRMAKNPGGYSGTAFLFEARAGRRGDGPRWRRGGPPPVRLELYVAWSAPGLERRLSHEVAHALLRLRLGMAGFLPVWLDEGIATYLEMAPDRRGRLVSRGVREDLLAELDRAAAAGNALSPFELLIAPRSLFTGEQARARYAQAWSMIHFLLHARSTGRSARFHAYLDRIAAAPARDPQPLEVFREVYGEDLEKLEAAWKKHLESLRPR